MALNNSWSDTTSSAVNIVIAPVEVASVTPDEEVNVGHGNYTFTGVIDNGNAFGVNVTFSIRINGTQVKFESVALDASEQNNAVSLDIDATTAIEPGDVISIWVYASAVNTTLESGATFTLIKDVPLQIHIGPWSTFGSPEGVVYFDEPVAYNTENVVRTA